VACVGLWVLRGRGGEIDNKSSGTCGGMPGIPETHNTNIACAVGTAQKMDRAQDAALTNQGTRQSERATRVVLSNMQSRYNQACNPGILRRARRTKGHPQGAQNCVHSPFSQ
jgi:hypothetical protein